jgi:hypothetical protein
VDGKTNIYGGIEKAVGQKKAFFERDSRKHLAVLNRPIIGETKDTKCPSYKSPQQNSSMTFEVHTHTH